MSEGQWLLVGIIGGYTILAFLHGGFMYELNKNNKGYDASLLGVVSGMFFPAVWLIGSICLFVWACYLLIVFGQSIA